MDAFYSVFEILILPIIAAAVIALAPIEIIGITIRLRNLEL
jgi:hypothetical protein